MRPAGAWKPGRQGAETSAERGGAQELCLRFAHTRFSAQA